MTGRTGAFLGLLVVLLLLPAAVAHADTAPPPGLGIRLVDAPTDRADDPRARVYVVDRVRPGSTFVRRVEVSNGDKAAMDVLLYSAPATLREGRFEIAPRGARGLVATWADVTPTTLRLAPGQRVVASVTVRVPADAPAGEAYGAIVAERPPQPGATLGVALRTAIRVYLSVGKGAEPASDFTVDTLTAGRDRAGRPYVAAQVHNTGGRALDLTGTLRLADGPGELSAGPFEVSVPTTLGVGQTAPLTIPLGKALPAGPWLATLDLRSGLVQRRVQATLTFPAGSSATSAPVVPKELPLYQRKGVVVPVAALLIGLLSLALLVVGLVTAHRRGWRWRTG
jgi:hypothetical protein